jgi:hypothetical protein
LETPSTEKSSTAEGTATTSVTKALAGTPGMKQNISKKEQNNSRLDISTGDNWDSRRRRQHEMPKPVETSAEEGMLTQ